MTMCMLEKEREHNKFDWDRRGGKTARQVVGAFRIPQEFPESLPQWVITRIRPRLSPLVAPSLTWPAAHPRAGFTPAHPLPPYPPFPPTLVRARGMDPRHPASVSLSNHPVATRVPTPHPPQPLIFSRFRPTPAAYPGNALGSVIASRGTGLDIVRKVTVCGAYICVCVCSSTCMTPTPTKIFAANGECLSLARTESLTDIIGL